MSKNSFYVLGVMSGTSLDGIDFAYVKFEFNKTWRYNFYYTETKPYPSIWKQKLTDLVGLNKEDLFALDISYTEYLANEINHFIKKHNIKKLDAICSHGHTALHRPDLGYTVQIGNRKEIALITKTLTICNFRVQDVQLGGQGAPLVPIGDKLLFADYGFCLNLGGFANLSTELNGERIAYDICPVNIVLNHFAEKSGKSFDENGNMASMGVLNKDLLSQLNSLPFYRKAPPKSLGLEWVNMEVMPILESSNDTAQNILRTLTEHIAIQLSSCLICSNDKKVLVTGGGAFNKFLMERLSSRVNCSIVIPEKNLVEFKEALIFGLLGVLKLRGEINCLASVTGADKDHSSGMIFEP